MKLAFIVILAIACIFSNINAQLGGEEEHKLELRQRRSNGRPYLPRPTPRPNFNRGKREVSSEIDLEDIFRVEVEDRMVALFAQTNPGPTSTEEKGVSTEID
ncbi:hypothetical protein JTB14_013939 [Gonioctena quinquepunctata]|nr:hypothetical protein JTB14_013939 [Gonioctena quinquepunctata]